MRRVIDPGKPVAVILAMVLHFFDAGTAAQIVAGYAAAIAPGSYLVISAGSGDERTGGRWPVNTRPARCTTTRRSGSPDGSPGWS